MFEKATFLSAGKFVSQRRWIHPEIAIDETELIIVDHGTIMIEESNIRYSLIPGDVLFLEPGIIHRGYETSHEAVSFWWIHIKNFDINDCDVLEKHFSASDPNNISILCNLLLHYSGLASGKEVNDRLLYLLLFELSQQYLSENQTEKPIAQRVYDWVVLNSSRILSANEVASQFKYNADYLSRLCKKHYGSNLNAIIIETKISQIKKILLDSRMPLNEIAIASGFTSYTQFRQFFKYHTGMSPRTYQKTNYALFINDK